MRKLIHGLCFGGRVHQNDVHQCATGPQSTISVIIRQLGPVFLDSWQPATGPSTRNTALDTGQSTGHKVSSALRHVYFNIVVNSNRLHRHYRQFTKEILLRQVRVQWVYQKYICFFFCCYQSWEKSTFLATSTPTSGSIYWHYVQLTANYYKTLTEWIGS